MRPGMLARVAGVAVLAASTMACVDGDLAVSRRQAALGHDPCLDPKTNDPLLCGWENGAPEWFNLFQKSSAARWLGMPDAKPVLEAWERPWMNDWETNPDSPSTPQTNSYAIGWSRKFSSGWTNFVFSSTDVAWAPRPRQNVGFTGNGCSHPTTRPGPALPPDAQGHYCNDVVAAVCAQRSSCCAPPIVASPGDRLGLVGFPGDTVGGWWDSQCVDLAVSSGATGGGAHTVSNVGIDLPAYDRTRLPVFSQGKLAGAAVLGGGLHTGIFESANLCARKVCTGSLAYCCSSNWDEACVAEAMNACSARYTTNTRVEAETQEDGSSVSRVFTDVCYEATTPGFDPCPVAPSTANGGKECCRRALVLRGVYSGIDTRLLPNTDDRYQRGRIIDWLLSATVYVPWVGQVAADATLIVDPCYTKADGTDTCQERKHKLFQAAGPGGPLYPDLPEDPQTVCPGNPKAFAERCADFTHSGMGYRDLLMATVSALVTTDGKHDVDIQWRPQKYFDVDGRPVGVSEMTIVPFLDQTPAAAVLTFADLETWEGNWGTHPLGPGHLVTEAACYGPHAPQRAHGDLVHRVPVCDPLVNPVGSIQTFFNVPPVLSQ